MGLYRKKPMEVEADQWFIDGDHDEVKPYGDCFLLPDNEMSFCPVCDKPLFLHGYVGTLEGGQRVCPGDYIIKGIEGEFYPCKPDIFNKTYDPCR
jgi:hypothetical protein